MDFSNQENNAVLAEIFRKQRNVKGFSLEDVAAQTGIPELHLKNIESGKFEEFDPFYLKMYLKKYGAFLGVDLKEAYLKAYGLQEGPEPVTIKTPKNLDIRNPRATTKKKFRRGSGKILATALLLIAAVFGIYFGWDMIRAGFSQDPEEFPIQNPHTPDLGTLTEDGENEDASPQEGNVEESAGNDEYGTAEISEQGSGLSIELATSDDREQIFSVVSTEEELEVRLVFSGETWIGSENNTVIPFENGELTEAGFTRNTGDVETLVITDSTTLYFNLPNTDRVGFFIGDEPIPVDYSIRHQRITVNITME